jgi:hypothetical protein
LDLLRGGGLRRHTKAKPSSRVKPLFDPESSILLAVIVFSLVDGSIYKVTVSRSIEVGQSAQLRSTSS